MKEMVNLKIFGKEISVDKDKLNIYSSASQIGITADARWIETDLKRQDNGICNYNILSKEEIQELVDKRMDEAISWCEGLKVTTGKNEVAGL